MGIQTDPVPKVALASQAVKHKYRLRERQVTTTAAAAGTRHYTGTFPADPAQVRQARAALAALLHDHPRASDAILIASEFATNSVVHSASRDGGDFTLRAEVHPDYIRIEVADAGGPWHGGARDDGRPHGLDIVEAIAGPHHWGMDEDTDGRIAWAELDK